MTWVNSIKSLLISGKINLPTSLNNSVTSKEPLPDEDLFSKAEECRIDILADLVKRVNKDKFVKI